MLKRFLFWRSSKASGGAESAELSGDIYGREIRDIDLIMNLPKQTGIPVFSLSTVKKLHKAQIATLIKHAGVGDHRRAENGQLLRDALYTDVLDNFIEYVHMVPASEGYHHSKPGGLLMHCLEVATMAIRISKAERLPGASGYIDVQRDLEARLPYAAFLGGLLHDTGKLFTDMRVSALYACPNDSSDISEDVCVTEYGLVIPDWQPAKESLLRWAKRFRVTRYNVTYLPTRFNKRHTSQSGQLIPSIISPEGLDYILSSEANLHGLLVDALNDYNDSQDYLGSVIRRADLKSAAEDAIRVNSTDTGSQKMSTCQKIYKLIQIAYPGWSFNKPSGHVWCMAGNVFLSWTGAFESIIDASRKTGIFIPRSSEFLYELMLESSIVKKFGGKERTVKFVPGDFTRSDVMQIHAGEQIPEWKQLIQVRDWNTLFDGDSLPKGGAGIIHAPKSEKYFLFTKQGEVEVFKPEDLERFMCEAPELSSESEHEYNTPADIFTFLPDGIKPFRSKHKGFLAIDAAALGQELKMKAAEAVESLISKGAPFKEVPGQSEQLVEIVREEKGIKLIAYISEQSVRNSQNKSKHDRPLKLKESMDSTVFPDRRTVASEHAEALPLDGLKS